VIVSVKIYQLVKYPSFSNKCIHRFIRLIDITAAVHKQKPSKDDSVPASKKRKRANKNSDEDVKSKATKKSISGVGGKARNAKAWSEEQDKFVFNLLSDGHGSKKNDVSWKEAREELNNRFPDNPKNLSAIRFRWSTVLQHGSTDLNEEEVSLLRTLECVLCKITINIPEQKKHFFQAINDLEKRDEIMFIMERFKSLSGRTLTKHATKKIYSDVKKGILKQGSDLTSRDEDKDDDSGSDLES